MRVEDELPLRDLLLGRFDADEGLMLIKRWLTRENPVCLRHPHGFYVALLKRGLDEEWRFHLWPKGPRVITGMPAFVHTHDSDVESRVLSGALTNTLYDIAHVSSEGQPLYQVGYSADRYLSTTRNWLENTGSRIIVCRREEQYVIPGKGYIVDADDFHEATISENCVTATLVRMTARRPATVYVAGVDGYASRIDFVRTPVAGRQIAEQI
ncbi:hypothetical protein [Sphingomonas sp. IC-11]|uniref:hypothetical protein n=1 Tax=Sphingomonas sp. IC-11 TaxID=2898528 RepID=UPI001E2D338A|nr:hypothetical protein [Sphingomonas sp. IC-11]